MGGIFGLSFSRQRSGDAHFLSDSGKLENTAYGDYNSGGALTQEGLAGLRSLDSTYADRLKDPLGDVGRGIFARARGALTDSAQRSGSSSRARIFQLATQSGGVLSPEAQAQLQAQGDRGRDEALFSSQNELANQEAGMTLTETSKLFDRMEGLRKTILGVGQDEKTRALQSIIASLTNRVHRTGSVSGSVNVGGGT